jgi:hypothetical protein
MSGTLRADVLALIAAYDWVSWAELSRLPGFTLENDADSRELPHGRGKFLWANMTPAAAAIMADLLNNREVTLAPASVLTYAVDGLIPQSKAWLPTVLRPAAKANDIFDNGVLLYNPKRKTKSKRLRAAGRAGAATS